MMDVIVIDRDPRAWVRSVCGCARVVLNSSSIVIACCVGHTSVHSDRGPRAWGSGEYARCVEQQQGGVTECVRALC